MRTPAAAARGRGRAAPSYTPSRMEIAYRLEESDLHDVQAQLVALRRAGLAASAWPFVGAVAGAAAISWPLWTALYPGRPLLLSLRPFAFALAAAATVAALLEPALLRRRSPRLEAWTVRRLARASARRSVLGPVAVTIAEDGVVRRNDEGELLLRRTDVRDVLATDRLLTVRLRRSGKVILLPARAFPDAGAFASARARLEALAGAPAVEIDVERGTASRPGPPPRPRRLRPGLAAALLLALAAAAVHGLAVRTYDPRRTNADRHVVLYATAWCPACARLRACLAGSGVPYEERDVERSRDALAEYEQLGGGGVPVTLVGQDVVYGLDRALLATALGAAGHRFDCPAASGRPERTPLEPGR